MKRSSAFCLFLILIAIACAINPVTGRRGLKEYLAQSNVNKESWTYIAIMNELKDAESIPPMNQLIKVIR